MLRFRELKGEVSSRERVLQSDYPMIQFGRLDAQQRWAALEPHSIEECLRLLYRAFLDEDAPYPKREVFFAADTLPAAISSANYSIDFLRDDLSGQGSRVSWISSHEYTLGTGWVRATLRELGGAEAGGLIVKLERSYRAEELGRAFEASFDAGLERPGRFAVLDSRRTPKASIRKLSAGVPKGRLGAFCCENAACPNKNTRVYIPLSIDEYHRHWAQSLNVPAYQCPYCPGEDDSRWALTFDTEQPATSADREPTAEVLHYPVRPLFKRVTNKPGRVWLVTGQGDPLAWGSTWNSQQVEKLSPELIDCLTQPYLGSVLRAASQGGNVGRLATCVLNPVNTRALVEQVRALDTEQKTEELAEALATVYDPRRPSRFESEDDRTAPPGERYPYIALAARNFFRVLQFFDVMEHTGRFLDVGCGVGEKPFLAYALGKFSQCDGLEVNEQTLTVANYLLSSITSEIPYPISWLGADALNFEGYADYDVIYMFRPLKQLDLMGDVIREIARQLKPGAKAFDVFASSLAFTRKDDGLYRLDPDSGDKAEWIGPIDIEDFIRDNGLARRN